MSFRLADFLRPIRNRSDEKVDEAMSAIQEKTDDFHRAVERLDNIVRRNIERTVDRAMDENARLTGRKRH